MIQPLGYRVLYDDLFLFGQGLCQLRIYRDDQANLMALAVELEDNPGQSIFNAPEILCERIAAVFGPQFRLFIHYPNRADESAVWIDVPSEPGDGTWAVGREISHAAIEEFLGAVVSLPVTGAASAAAVGGSSHPLLALMPPEEEELTVIDKMRVVAVADLPWPHHPSGCAHADRFDAIRQLYEKGSNGHIPAGAHFFLNLNSEDFAACRYHRYDWLTIAAASLELFERLEPDSDRHDVRAAAAELLPEGPDREELIFLFFDPIKWSPGATSITNGQHRACALKAAGAPFCVARTYGQLHDEPAAGDAYRRAQSVLAQYWARQLGQDPPPSSMR